MTELELLTQLDALLDEDRDAALRREQNAFDDAAGPLADRLVLFGAGNLGRKTLAGLRRVGTEPLAFSDNDPNRWDTDVDGLMVLSPTEAARRFGREACFVLTIWRGEGKDRMPDRIEPLKALGCARVVPFTPLYWKYAAEFLPHYAMDLPHLILAQAEEIQAVGRLWSDSASRQEYVAQLRWRLHMDFDGLLDPVAHEIYFPDDLFRIADDESFVDCGAFDGDTLRRWFIRQPEFVGDITAFEPDPQNFLKLEAYVASLPETVRARIRTFPYAVAASRKKVRFDATGNEAAAVGAGNTEIDAVALDDLFENRSPPTYIKMDTEGSEPAGIVGSRRIIHANTPALALCVYHRQNHLWKVPSLVRAQSDDYAYFLRPHLLEGWDTVLYSIPKGRLLT